MEQWSSPPGRLHQRSDRRSSILSTIGRSREDERIGAFIPTSQPRLKRQPFHAGAAGRRFRAKAIDRHGIAIAPIGRDPHDGCAINRGEIMPPSPITRRVNGALPIAHKFPSPHLPGEGGDAQVHWRKAKIATMRVPHTLPLIRAIKTRGPIVRRTTGNDRPLIDR